MDNKQAKFQKDFEPKSKEAYMAVSICKSLKDEDNLGLYLNYCKKYPEHLIFRVFGMVKETPDKKIKKSRGALFTYLVKKLAKQMGIHRENKKSSTG